MISGHILTNAFAVFGAPVLTKSLIWDVDDIGSLWMLLCAAVRYALLAASFRSAAGLGDSSRT